jgi:hypothetical protein
LLPCLLVRRKPIRRDLTIQISIANSRALHSRPKRLRTSVRHIILNRLVDKPAPLPGLRDLVDRLDRCLRQDNIDALTHEGPPASSYTPGVYVNYPVTRQDNLRKIGDCLLCPKAPPPLATTQPTASPKWTERAVLNFSPRPLNFRASCVRQSPQFSPLLIPHYQPPIVFTRAGTAHPPVILSIAGPDL